MCVYIVIYYFVTLYLYFVYSVFVKFSLVVLKLKVEFKSN